MSFFFSDAYAQAATATPAGGPDLLGILLPVILIAVFYFVLIRPQSNRAKEHAKMVSALSKGDEVVTNGGALGRIVDVGENFVRVEITENTQVWIQKQAIASLMPKGTIKSL